MRPLRRRPVFAHLALFALAMQLVASFGHVHAHPASHQSLSLASRTFFAPVSGACLPRLPDHLDCTICVAMNLLGSSAMPQAAPELGLVPRLAGLLSADGAVRVTLDAVTASFQARAPPGRDLA